MTDNVFLLLKKGFDAPLGIFQIDTSRYGAKDIHYKVGVKNILPSLHKQYARYPDNVIKSKNYYTSDLKSIIKSLNEKVDSKNAKLGFYEIKDADDIDFDADNISESLLYMFKSFEDPEKVIVLKINEENSEDGEDAFSINVVYDTTKSDKNKSGDSLKLITGSEVDHLYDDSILVYNENYLEDRVKSLNDSSQK